MSLNFAVRTVERTAGPSSVEVFLSPTFRISMTSGCLMGVVYIVLSVVRVLSGWESDSRFFPPVVQAIMGLWFTGYFGWLAYCSWSRPILRLTPSSIEWLPLCSRQVQQIPLADVTGFRWPYRADLWIEGRGHPTLQARMVWISQRDRSRVHAWLSERWVDGGVVV